MARYRRLTGAPLSRAETKLLAAYDLKHPATPPKKLRIDMQTPRDPKPYRDLIATTEEMIGLLCEEQSASGDDLSATIELQKRQLVTFREHLTEIEKHNATLAAHHEN